MTWRDVTAEQWMEAIRKCLIKWNTLPKMNEWREWFENVGSKISNCGLCKLFEVKQGILDDETHNGCPIKDEDFVCSYEFDLITDANKRNDYGMFECGFKAMQSRLKSLNSEEAYHTWRAGKLKGEIIEYGGKKYRYTGEFGNPYGKAYHPWNKGKKHIFAIVNTDWRKNWDGKRYILEEVKEEKEMLIKNMESKCSTCAHEYTPNQKWHIGQYVYYKDGSCIVRIVGYNKWYIYTYVFEYLDCDGGGNGYETNFREIQDSDWIVERNGIKYRANEEPVSFGGDIDFMYTTEECFRRNLVLPKKVGNEICKSMGIPVRPNDYKKS